MSSLAEEHEHCPDGEEEVEDTCPPDDGSARDSPSLLEQIDTNISSTSTNFKSSKNELKHNQVGITETGSKYGNMIVEYDSDNEITAGSARDIEIEGHGDPGDIEDFSDTDSVKSESLLGTPSTKDVHVYTKLKSKDLENGFTQSHISYFSKQEEVVGNTDNHIFTVKASSVATVTSDRAKSISRDTVLSPLISSSRDSTKLQNYSNKQTCSPLVTGPHLTTDQRLSEQVVVTRTLSQSSTTVESPNIDIKQPHSNDSMWSEADDSDYLNISDSNFTVHHTSSVKIIASDTPNSVHALSSKTNNGTCRDTDEHMFDTDSPFVCSSIASQKNFINNQSTCSQWSELEDEHYITALDLVDIQNMSKQTIEDTHEEVGTPQKPLHATSYRQIETVTPPHVFNVDDVIVPTTPDESPSVQRSPGIKRQLSWKQHEVSPMKKRLASLTFE